MRNVILLTLVGVVGFAAWNLGYASPEAREGPAPNAATVTFDYTTPAGHAIQEVHAFDSDGNFVFKRTSARHTIRRIYDRQRGIDTAVDDTLGSKIVKRLGRSRTEVLNHRYLGKNPECIPSDSYRPVTHTQNPAINSIKGFRVVKNTQLLEPELVENCSDCAVASHLTETWLAPDLGCLPLKMRSTTIDQPTGRVTFLLDREAKTVLLSADPGLFATGSVEKVKPTEFLRRQGERWPNKRESTERSIEHARSVNLDERYE